MNCLLVGVKIALNGMAGRHGRHVLRSNSRQRVSSNLPFALEAHSPLILHLRTLGFASIMGIIEDTKLVGQQYSWLTTCGKSCDSLWHLPPISSSCSLSCYVWPSHVAFRPQTNNYTRDTSLSHATSLSPFQILTAIHMHTLPFFPFS